MAQSASSSHFRNSGPASSNQFYQLIPLYLGLSGSQLLLHILCCNSGFSGLLSVLYQTGSDKAKSTVNLGGWEHKKRWCICYCLVQESGETMGRVLKLPLIHRSPSSRASFTEGRTARGNRQIPASLSSTPNDTDEQYRRPCGQCGVHHSQVVGQKLLGIQLQADAIVPHHSKLKPDPGILKQTSQRLCCLPVGARVGKVC